MASVGEGFGSAMGLAATPRSQRLLSRLPRPTVYTAAELLLLLLLAVQAARLVWALVTPVGPLGDWKAPSALAAPPASGAGLGEFDPFFRLSGPGGPAVVTTLNLKLYGVREDRATGRGSAIIALPDGTQQSFAVGDELMPGVRLAEVGFDSVTIDRGGAREQIFLDQSTPAPAAGQPPAAPSAPAPAPAPMQNAPPPPTPPPGAPISMSARVEGGRVNGILVGPGGDGGQAFRAAGFEAGDVIVAINGQRVTSLEQARAAIGQSGGQVMIMVERGGRAVPLRVRLNP